MIGVHLTGAYPVFPKARLSFHLHLGDDATYVRVSNTAVRYTTRHECVLGRSPVRECTVSAISKTRFGNAAGRRIRVESNYRYSADWTD